MVLPVVGALLLVTWCRIFFCARYFRFFVYLVCFGFEFIKPGICPSFFSSRKKKIRIAIFIEYKNRNLMYLNLAPALYTAPAGVAFGMQLLMAGNGCRGSVNRERGASSARG